MDSNVRFMLAARLVNGNADPLVFEFQRDLFNDNPAYVSISRLGWQALSPSQAIGYITDRYLLEHPEEEQRVGRTLITYCINQALGIPNPNPGRPVR